MSKKSEKKTKVLEYQYDHPQSYYQAYIPTPYVAATYEQPIVIVPNLQPTQIITTEPTVIRERRVVQGESQFIKQEHVIQEQNCCMSSCMTCAPCFDKEQKVVTRQVVLKEKQPIVNEDYEKKLDNIEKLHIQEIREMELMMQQQLEQLQNQKLQDEQKRQLLELQQSLFDIKNQLNQRVQQNQPPQQQNQIINQYQIQRLENQLDKKKKRIKELKQILNNMQIELQQQNTQIQDLDLRLRQPIPQQVIHVPVVQENYDLINQVRYLEQERNALLREIDSLKFTNSELSQLSFRDDPEKIKLKQDYTRMINDFRFLEQENVKMVTIIGQKDELIKSLEQRISVELQRQSILLQQQSPQRIVLEQTTTTRPIQTQYVIDQQQQQYLSQPIHKQYIIQDQPIQTIQPTLLQQQQQTLPNVKIIS